MKKKDLIPIIALFALFLAYPTIDKKIIAKYFPPKEKPVPAAAAETAQAGGEDRLAHKVALVRRLAAATIEDAQSRRQA